MIIKKFGEEWIIQYRQNENDIIQNMSWYFSHKESGLVFAYVGSRQKALNKGMAVIKAMRRQKIKKKLKEFYVSKVILRLASKNSDVCGNCGGKIIYDIGMDSFICSCSNHGNMR